jgi:hypothetical protein
MIEKRGFPRGVSLTMKQAGRFRTSFAPLFLWQEFGFLARAAVCGTLLDTGNLRYRTGAGDRGMICSHKRAALFCFLSMRTLTAVLASSGQGLLVEALRGTPACNAMTEIFLPNTEP